MLSSCKQKNYGLTTCFWWIRFSIQDISHINCYSTFITHIAYFWHLDSLQWFQFCCRQHCDSASASMSQSPAYVHHSYTSSTSFWCNTVTGVAPQSTTWSPNFSSTGWGRAVSWRRSTLTRRRSTLTRKLRVSGNLPRGHFESVAATGNLREHSAAATRNLGDHLEEHFESAAATGNS